MTTIHSDHTNIPSSTSIDFSYAEEVSHSSIDRVSNLASNIQREYSEAMSSTSYYPKAILLGKAIAIPYGVVTSGTISGFAKQALLIDGSTKLGKITNIEPRDGTSIPNEALNGLIRTGTVFGSNFIQAGNTAMKNTFDELLFNDDLSKKEIVANHAALMATGLAILPFAFNGIKNTLIGVEIAALSYEAYKNKDLVLDHPSIKAISNLSTDDFKGVYDSSVSTSKSFCEGSLKKWNGFSTEEKVLVSAASLAAVIGGGYALTYIPSAIDAIKSGSSRLITVGNKIGRAYLAFRAAEAVFESNKEKKA